MYFKEKIIFRFKPNDLNANKLYVKLEILKQTVCMQLDFKINNQILKCINYFKLGLQLILKNQIGYKNYINTVYLLTTDADFQKFSTLQCNGRIPNSVTQPVSEPFQVKSIVILDQWVSVIVCLLTRELQAILSRDSSEGRSVRTDVNQ